MNNDANESPQFNAFKKGNELAFEYFFEKYYRGVLGFSVEFVSDVEDAKEITQESFINLWLNKEHIETTNGIKSFLYTYAKSKSLNHIRHNKVKEKYKNKTLNDQEKLLNIQVLNALDFDTLSLSELETLILKSIEELPNKTKEIFVKKRFQNKKNKEIAEELDLTVKTVEAHITKALKVLKTKLSIYLPSILITLILYTY
jgi:RNA polymerase sigma-70 factor (ECF subfamily)